MLRTRVISKLNHLRPRIPSRLVSQADVSCNSAVQGSEQVTVEAPVLVIAQNDYIDVIGPPDASSNLRPVIRSQLSNETSLHQRLRLLQDNTQIWNQNFWALHNSNFMKERQKYIEKRQKLKNDTSPLSPDELSEFYKDFLDRNWETHVQYNFEWYKRNFRMLFLAFYVNLERICSWKKK